MMRRMVVIGLMLMLVVLGGIWSLGCGGDEESVPIKIGAMMEITGPVARWGAMQQAGIELRLEQAGWEVAGRKIELIVGDSASDLNLVQSLAHKFVEQDKVNIIIGPLNHDHMVAIEPYLAENKVPEIYISQGTPETESENEWFFAPPGVVAQSGYYTGKYAYELGHRTASVLGADFLTGYQWVGAFTQGFEEMGGKVVSHAGWAPIGTVDYGPYLASLEQADVFVAWTVPATFLVKQYGEFGLWDKMPLVLIYANEVPESDLPELGTDAVGMVAAALYHPSIDNPTNKAFVAAFREKYNRDPCEWDAIGYDAASVAVAALEATEGDTTPEKLRDAIQNVKVDLPTGPFSFSAGGFGIRSIYMLEVVETDGQLHWEIVKEYPADPEGLPIPPSSK